MAKTPKAKAGNIVETMNALGEFKGPSWNRWRAILKGAYALPMTEEELTLFREVAEREPPTKRVRELIIIGGRRGAKSAISSLIVTDAALRFDGKRRTIGGVTLPAMRKGERATVFCLGPDRDTARIVLVYVKGYFQNIPALKAMVTRETLTGLELVNGCDVVVASSDYRSIRGRAVLCAVLDETAMMRDEFSARPDTEVFAALKPGTMTLRDQAMIVAISTPLTKTGLLWQKYADHYGKPDDNILVIRGDQLAIKSSARCAGDRSRDRGRSGQEPKRVPLRVARIIIELHSQRNLGCRNHQGQDSPIAA